jgi:signal transduction histidine kinase/CheY-like chemotaxis protein
MAKMRSRSSPDTKTRKARLAKPQAKKKRAGNAVNKAAIGKKAARARSSAKAPVLAAKTVEAALATFAHEVRTPLTGILAVSDLLATSNLGERERRWVDTIRASADHLSALATLFVDAARSGQTELDLRQNFFDLHTLAQNAADSLAGRATARGLRSSGSISDQLPVFVTGDPVRLRAALENLIDNAVKFTEQGRVDLKISVARRAKKHVVVAFAISDSGIGLSLAEIKGLFRPFSQANVTIAARFGGAGLGLSSVRQIARAMGGDVAVSQRRGRGTVFTLTVKLDLANAEADHAPGTDIDVAPYASNPALRILSVEDNPFGRVVLNAVLTELGHQVEFVGDGESAFERIENAAFDAVLMDMVLPGINGVEAIRHIRTKARLPARLAIIGVSGRGEDEKAARAAGADAFLLKPVSPRALAAALLKATRRTKA